ncbi:unnamed protein product [Trifolium pratense]|nr:unnamed protein product [Trifolium pratense]
MKIASAEKDENKGPEVVVVDDLVAGDRSLKNAPSTGVAGRTRSRAGKSEVIASTPVHKSKPDKSAKMTGKKVVTGPPRTKSKVIPTSEVKKKNLKRKEAPSSESDFERETSVATSGGTSRRSVKGRKVHVTVPYAPLDNIYFHLENGSARWKYVYHRRLALERNLKENVFKCKNVADVIKHAGSMKTVSDLGNCYDRLVFVRGRCVHFSPSIINKYLGRSDEEVAELEVTDNEICRTITGNRLKQWPSQIKLSASQLSPLYAILNKIVVVNWVPTTHSSNVAKELGRFIYAVGTKARFDYGAYFFDATLEHAVSFALQLPIAFPTLLCGIILDQHPNILVDADGACRRSSELTVSKKLLSGTHVDAGVGTSAQQMAGTLTKKQMIAELTETSRSLEERKHQIDLVIAALKAEEEADQAEDEQDGHEEDEDSGTDGETEKMEEDSDESSSA